MASIQSQARTSGLNTQSVQPQIKVLNPQDDSLVGVVTNNSVSDVKSVIETAVLGAKKACVDFMPKSEMTRNY